MSELASSQSQHSSFALDRYEPVAFHTHPELMRAAEAQTAVLPPVAAVVPPPATPTSVPPPVVSAPPPPPPTPTEPIAAYLIGMDATATLRVGLADFLDAAGARRDVRVSVGLAGGDGIAWALRDQVPYGVRALPRYPEVPPLANPSAVLTPVADAVVEDAASEPRRRQLVLLVWHRTPAPLIRPPALAAALVVHAVDAALDPPTGNGPAGGWLLVRSRPGPSPSLLGHAGRLLDRWETFAAPPRGLVVVPYPSPRRKANRQSVCSPAPRYTGPPSSSTRSGPRE